MAYEWDWLKEYINNETIFHKGKKLYQEHAITSMEVDSNSSKELKFIHAVVKDQKRYYDVNLSIEKESGHIRGHLCDCANHEKYLNCEHCCALIMQMHEEEQQKNEEYIEKNKHKIMKPAIDLMNAYEEKLVFAALAGSTSFSMHLSVHLELKQNQLIFSLRLSSLRQRKKQYVIMHMESFIDALIHHESKGYGKMEPFLHHPKTFDDESQPLITFLMTHRHDFITLPNGTNTSVMLGKYCYVNDLMLDECFNMLEQSDVHYHESNQDNKPFVYTKERYPFVLDVQSVDERFYQFQLNIRPSAILRGRRYGYLLIDYIWYQCESDFVDRCFLLLESFYQESSLVMEHKYMKSFYCNVIASIKKYMQLSGIDILHFAPLPLENKLYIDMNPKGDITVDLYYCYGEQRYNAFSLDPYTSDRNINDEIKMRVLLSQFTTGIDQDQQCAIIKGTPKAVYDFLQIGLSELAKYSEIYMSEDLRKIKVHNRVKVSMGIRLENNLLALHLDVANFPKAELAELMKAYRINRRYYRMKNGSFVNLEDSGLGELSALLDNMHIDEKELQKDEIIVEKHHAILIDECASKAHFEVDRNEAFKQLIRDIHNVKDADHKVPASLKKTLRSYQKEGYRWLKTMSSYGFNGILADDMGIGKTLQILTLLLSERNQLPSIIITPSSLMWNWKNETARFTPELKVLMIHGGVNQRAQMISEIPNYDIIITSYDYLKRDIQLYEDIPFDYQIVDEAQYIKNQTTQNAMSVKLIQTKHRFALTGTPIENHLGELWSIFDFLMPGYLYSYPQFRNIFEIPIVKEKDTYVLQQLKTLVEPFILRRMKQDVLKELPEKSEHTIYIELNEDERQRYQTNIALMKTQLQETMKDNTWQRSSILFLSMLTKLRQLCNDSRLLYNDVDAISSKLKACMDIVENYRSAHKKVLIFSQFTSMLGLIEKQLQQQGIPYYLLKGNTPKLLRAQYVNAFQEDDTPVFLISLKAGGTGLNLTSAEAVIHFDPWWNVSAQNQASDRAYRLGQHRNVQIIRLIAKNTIEEKILDMQKQKQALSNSILDINENVLTSMSKDELLALFTTDYE